MQEISIVWIIAAIFVQTSVAVLKCTFSLDDLANRHPVFLIKNEGKFNLYHPKQISTEFLINSSLNLDCGLENDMVVHNQIISKAQIVCKASDTGAAPKFVLNKLDVNINELSCRKHVRPRISKSNLTCGKVSDNALIYYLHFESVTNEKVNFLTVCYSKESASTIWSQHRLYGPSIKYIKPGSRSDASFYSAKEFFDPTQSYEKKTQVKNCNQLVNNCTQTFIVNADKGKSYSCYLAKGHLAPDADFAYPSLKSSTFMYLNSVPQYQCGNAGNWFKVEKNARTFAEESNVTLTILTGGHDNVQLPINSINVSFYLDNNKVIVPKYMWKIILRSTDSVAGIVFVMMNSPFAEASDMFSNCNTTVCANANIDIKGFEKIPSGYTACCKVDEFMNHVQEVPQNMLTSNLLVMNLKSEPPKKKPRN